MFKVGKINVWWLPEQGKNNTTVTNQVWHKEKHILSAGQVGQKHFCSDTIFASKIPKPNRSCRADVSYNELKLDKGTVPPDHIYNS